MIFTSALRTASRGLPLTVGASIAMIAAASTGHALSSQPATASIQSLGSLFSSPVTAPNSRAFGISSDGRYVSGWSNSNESGDRQAFVWSDASGMIGLGDLPGGLFRSEALAVSNTGVAVGSGAVANGSEAFRWTSSQGMMSIGTLGGSEKQAFAEDVSADGNVVVGQSKNVSNSQRAYRWAPATGMVEMGVGVLDPFVSSHAFAVSGDGSTIVGQGRLLPSSTTGAWRWTESTGFQDLGDLGSINSIPWEVSWNGSVAVGESNGNAFCWTAPQGMTQLTGLPGGSIFRRALAVSGNGVVVVGDTGFNGAAVIWDAQHEARFLEDALFEDYGLDLTNWTLESATDISADGRFITGYGRLQGAGQVAFIITLPVPEHRSAVLAAMALLLTPHRFLRAMLR
jgi:probable HAF family extracellular repeat protein